MSIFFESKPSIHYYTKAKRKLSQFRGIVEEVCWRFGVEGEDLRGWLREGKSWRGQAGRIQIEGGWETLARIGIIAG